jgi:hypothetical protein
VSKPFSIICQVIALIKPTDELLLEVLKYLSPEDLHYVHRTCSKFKTLANNNDLWKHLYKKYVVHNILGITNSANNNNNTTNGIARHGDYIQWKQSYLFPPPDKTVQQFKHIKMQHWLRLGLRSKRYSQSYDYFFHFWLVGDVQTGKSAAKQRVMVCGASVQLVIIHDLMLAEYLHSSTN